LSGDNEKLINGIKDKNKTRNQMKRKRERGGIIA
jgi:hypothetical protein